MKLAIRSFKEVIKNQRDISFRLANICCLSTQLEIEWRPTI